MCKVSAILALVMGLLMLGTAAAQEVPLECQLWGTNCPSDGGGDTGGGTEGDTDGDTNDGDTSGDTGDGDTNEEPSGDDTPSDDPAPIEDPCDLVGAVPSKTLPSSASAQGVANSAKGLQTASQASANGRGFGQCRSGKG
jgi:hypothetical protein